MTKKQKVEAIYRAKPELANDDIGLIIYILKRCGYAQLTLEQAMRKMGNPEHWTRAARLVRAEHPELVDDKVREAREEEFVEYKYNDKPQQAISWLKD
jgi:hypothetical protein